MISPYTRKAGMGRASSPARSWAGASVCPNISVKIRIVATIKSICQSRDFFNSSGASLKERLAINKSRITARTARAVGIRTARIKKIIRNTGHIF